jgi:hypothetical protein
LHSWGRALILMLYPDMPARNGWHKSQRYMEAKREIGCRPEGRCLAIWRRNKPAATLGHNMLCPYMADPFLCQADQNLGQYT